MAKLPHEIDCKIDLIGDAYAIIVDGERFNQPELPKGLEGMVNHLQFVRSFVSDTPLLAVVGLLCLNSPLSEGVSETLKIPHPLGRLGFLFSQGAQEVIIERGDKSNLVYRLESDQIRNNQRWFLYRRV